MRREDELYAQSMDAWFKAQQYSIESCELNIKHNNEQIELLIKSNIAESAELVVKYRHLEVAQANFEQWKKENT